MRTKSHLMKRKLAHLLSTVVLTLGAMHASSAMTLEEAKESLPASIKESGELKLAVYLKWAPFEFVDANNKPVGIDVELGQLLAAKLGLKASFSDLASTTIIPGVASGRFDAAIAQLVITKDRERVVDFIPYFVNDWRVLTKTGAPELDPNNLCGHTLVATQGSAQATMLDEISNKCVSDKKAKVNVIFVTDGSQTYLAVANGRGEGFVAPGALAVYLAERNQHVQASKEKIRGFEMVSGIAVNKNQQALRQALATALDEVMRDGSYEKVLVKYGVPGQEYRGSRQ
jgi:polar amino acid transport system substrate-binding protein